MTRVTHRYQKRGISQKIRRRRFWEIKDFGLGRLPTHATTLQEVEIFPTLILVPIFGLKMVERVKGLFGQKKCPKLDFLCLGEVKLFLGEAIRLGEGKRCQGEGVCQGKGGLCLGEPKVNFHAMFYFA